jgi:hypothetical protein
MNPQPCTSQLEDSVRLRDCEFQLEVIRELGEAILSRAALYDALQLVADRAREMVAADAVLGPMLLPAARTQKASGECHFQPG